MKYITLLSLLLLPITGLAQQADTLRADLAEIRIEVSRGQAPLGQLPFSVTTWQRTEPQRLTSPSSSFSSALESVPGVYFGNRDNFSLGERLSIRGMGWRASFGVRGVQVLLNGIPLTSPDGQTILEVIDPNMIREAQIIRGPNAVYWGNGSGGTLYLSTGGSEEGISTRAYAGSFGTFGQDVSVNRMVGPTNVQVDVSGFQTEGYRDYSSARLNRLSLQVRRDLNNNRSIRYSGFAALAPNADNPGALTNAQLESDRTSANPLFVTQKAGKSYTHIMQGVRYSVERDSDRFETTVFGTIRDLRNPIQPSIIEINRLSGGARLNYQRNLGAITMLLATDAARQHDLRQNWVNAQGLKGNQTIRQYETVQSIGTAAVLQSSFGALTLSGGLRYDWIYFKADDRLAQSELDDASGTRLLSALSPQLGFTYATTYATVFGGFSSAFESPTTTELANRPDLQRGFNPDLQPETSQGLELGVRGLFPELRLSYEIVGYRIGVRDRLLAYQTEQGGDRNFFENAGKTRHMGIETAIDWRYFRSGFVRTSIMLQDVTITSNESGLEGNRVPGLPQYLANLRTGFENQDFMVAASLRYHGDMYANNANTVENQSWHSIDLYFSFTHNIPAYSLTLRPFASISNVLDARYNSSVTINAFGGRFFEPAQPRSFMAGLAVSFP